MRAASFSAPFTMRMLGIWLPRWKCRSLKQSCIPYDFSSSSPGAGGVRRRAPRRGGRPPAGGVPRHVEVPRRGERENYEVFAGRMRMSWAGPSVLFLAFLLPGPDKGPGAGGAPADRLATLQKEQKEAQAAYSKAVGALPDTPEGEKKAGELWKDFDKKQGERFLAAVALARSAPKPDAGFAPLEWVLTNPRAYYLPAGKAALELAAEQHAANPKVGKVVAWVGY